MVSLELKKACVEASFDGKTARQIYDEIFHEQIPTWSLLTFKRELARWKKKQFASDDTLHAGTYPNFEAHGATVQVDGNGNITQAWIKQHTDIDWDEIIEKMQGEIQPIKADKPEAFGDGLLEIPLFDMHFGVAKLEDYANILTKILTMINGKTWDTIFVIIGQDLIHNNDMRGHTAKGTDIDKVDILAAWEDAWIFWNQILIAAQDHSENVVVGYSKGNHDECISWCFAKALEARFPDVKFDLTLNPRKAYLWKGCFIGYGHCEYTRNSDKLFRDFVVEFPGLFSNSKVREIHAGHFHAESNDNGMVVRRLSTAVPTDEWNSNNGFHGTHKRFQLFEYAPQKLVAIYYV